MNDLLGIGDGVDQNEGNSVEEGMKISGDIVQRMLDSVLAFLNTFRKLPNDLHNKLLRIVQ
jgi:hypothetical protein